MSDKKDTTMTFEDYYDAACVLFGRHKYLVQHCKKTYGISTGQYAYFEKYDTHNKDGLNETLAECFPKLCGKSITERDGEEFYIVIHANVVLENVLKECATRAVHELPSASSD